MRPIVYNGVDLSGVCSAEVIEKVALPVEAETLAVPRRAGALLVAGRYRCYARCAYNGWGPDRGRRGGQSQRKVR